MFALIAKDSHETDAIDPGIQMDPSVNGEPVFQAHRARQGQTNDPCVLFHVIRPVQLHPLARPKGPQLVNATLPSCCAGLPPYISTASERRRDGTPAYGGLSTAGLCMAPPQLQATVQHTAPILRSMP